ncbi:MAG: T9SS type A sorting domain-containing protein [Candidatus Margulisiibacteriota bacterium]|nr:T9SS type A sorting domain-containing protein [Candidatus Margulisiibacteriota bacterium]
MKRLVVLLTLLLVSSAAFAASGASYKISPEGLLPTAGTSEGTTYSVQHASGDVSGITSSAAYSSNAGFIASSVTYATSEAGVPRIENLLFDGRAIVADDYVNRDVTITATVTDDAGSIDTAASSVEIDSAVIAFDALNGNSTYDAVTAQLTYSPATPFANGTHTFTIVARNDAGNSSSGTITFTVNNNGIALVDGTVFNFPNPYDPGTGNTEIGYRLNKDANITVYLFNSLGQRVWKREYAAGSEGGHAGYNFILWDGKSDFGDMVGNGIYFIRVVAGGSIVGKGKLAVIK